MNGKILLVDDDKKLGQEISLTGREFLLLSYLMENANKIISKEHLYEQIWGECFSISDNTIMVISVIFVKRLKILHQLLASLLL